MIKIGKKVAKITRIITVAPILAFILVTVLYLTKYFSLVNYIVAITFLVIFPLLAYPVQSKFKIIKGNNREAERKLAIIFSVIGYVFGFLFSLIFSANIIEKAVYLTYLLSVVFIFIFTYILKENVSGHMCGVTGPIMVIVYIFGPIYFSLLSILILVVLSSMYLKRHSLSQLIIGSIIPVIAFLISINIYK